MRKRQNPISLKRQQGVVIVVALFIVALVATMSYIMMSRLERDTRRTSMIIRNAQAEFYAQGSIAWAMDMLRNNWEKQKPNKIVDQTPITSPLIEVNGYKITSTIYDMQARFNLNNISTVEAQSDFKRLIQMVAPDMSEEKVRDIVSAVFDWITPMAQQSEYNKYYLELPAPYRPAHRAMLTSNELHLVKGMTPALYNLLQPYITALPNQTAVNIREAPAPVLLTLSPILTPTTAKAMEQLREQSKADMTSPQAFLNSDAVRAFQIAAEKIVTVSNYFLVATEVEIENQHVVLYTLLERTTKDNKAAIAILWQSKGIS